MEAQAALQCGTSPQAALALAEKLIGCWPHAKPPDPKTYSAAMSATLAGYPLKVAQECCDPRIGLAREREFPPTVAALVAWCDKRHEFYQSVAKYTGRSVALPAPEYSGEHCAEMRARIAEIPKVHFKAMKDAVK
jgi:hypothetical protein